MAREKKSDSAPQSRDVPGRLLPNVRKTIKWVNPHLNAEDIDWLQDNYDHLHTHVCEFVATLAEGYNLSNKYEDRSGRWLCSLVCDGSGDGNEGFGVSMRGATPLDALYALAYVAAIKLEWQFSGGATGITAKWG